MIHQIQITAGTATYSNMYVRTPRFEAERAAGRGLYPNFSDMISGKAGLDRILLTEEKMRRGLIPNPDTFERTPGSTSVRYHHGRLYCLQETGYAFVLAARVQGGRLHLDGSGSLATWSGEWEGPFSAPAYQPRAPGRGPPGRAPPPQS